MSWPVKYMASCGKSSARAEVAYDNNDRLTQEQAAKYLGVSLQTIIRWRKKKPNFPFVVLGKRRVYSKKLLKEFMVTGKTAINS